MPSKSATLVGLKAFEREDFEVAEPSDSRNRAHQRMLAVHFGIAIRTDQQDRHWRERNARHE